MTDSKGSPVAGRRSPGTGDELPATEPDFKGWYIAVLAELLITIAILYAFTRAFAA